MIEQLFSQIIAPDGEDITKRRALSKMRSEIKEESAYRMAMKTIGDGAALESLFCSADAKVRKNAAALLGDLKIQKAAPILYRAYDKEETLFVRGTILKALLQMDASSFLPELKKRYESLCHLEAAEEEKKHIREELYMLEQILRKEGDERRHTFIGWNARHAVLLTTNPKYGEITANKITAYRKKIISLGVQAIVDNLKEITEIRTFREMLFPIRLEKSITLEDGPEAFGEAVAESKLLFFLEKNHKEGEPFYFRLDVRAGLSLEERGRYIKRAAAVIEEKTERKMINVPTDYEFNVRLILDKERKIHIFLKLFTIPMERFAYRKGAISSSIHPSDAAMLLEIAKPYLKEDAQILDPCCGVGTMLVERHKIFPAREIYGIDIFREAIEKAKENTKEAGMHVNFIHKDYLNFTHNYLFDEIIANMPVRGKRTKEEQDDFYKGFFDKSEKLLALEGVMILYSNENGFVKKQLRLHPGLRLRKEFLIREKEDFWLFIIGLKTKL